MTIKHIDYCIYIMNVQSINECLFTKNVLIPFGVNTIDNKLAEICYIQFNII